MELSGRTYKITVGAPSSYEQEVVLDVMNYIETQYRTASLAGFCRDRGQPDYYISRLMKRYSPYTFTPVSPEAAASAGGSYADGDEGAGGEYHGGGGI